jgi:L-lactate dehydrogenase complex protein LldG
VRDGETDAARDEVLARVREALGGFEPPAVPRNFEHVAPATLDRVSRFEGRLVDYGAIVYRTGVAGLSEAVARALERRHSRRVVVPDAAAAEWCDAARFELVLDDPPLSHAELDAVDAIVTGCAVAVAETGTIVLDAGPTQGRRALSLLPDHHVCVVRTDQLVGIVPEVLPRLDPRRPLTWISGPSATSDIELSRVEGVHGPRLLDVIIVE